MTWGVDTTIMLVTNFMFSLITILSRSVIVNLDLVGGLVFNVYLQ